MESVKLFNVILESITYFYYDILCCFFHFQFPLNYDKTDLILERVHSVLNRVEKLDDTLEMSIAELRRDVVNDIGHLLRYYFLCFY